MVKTCLNFYSSWIYPASRHIFSSTEAAFSFNVRPKYPAEKNALNRLAIHMIGAEELLETIFATRSTAETGKISVIYLQREFDFFFAYLRLFESAYGQSELIFFYFTPCAVVHFIPCSNVA